MTVKLYRETVGDDGHTIVTDGAHIYFACTWTDRVRWALRYFPDDGIGIRTHGASRTLEGAVLDAHEMKKVRDNCGDGV